MLGKLLRVHFNLLETRCSDNCDNCPEFTNMISKSLQEVHNCKLIFSSPYHPQTNSLVESAHKTIKRALIKSINEKREDWFHYLVEQVTFSLNIRPRETTGYSAFELMHGSRKPRLPNEAENLSFLFVQKEVPRGNVTK